jgi:RNA polymerase sigma-70 factor (ECF subfamily)
MGEEADRFTTLFRRHHRHVLAYVLRRTDEARAEDVVAETFTAAWRHIDRLPDDPLPWLYRTAHNCLGNDRRSMRRRERLVGRLVRLHRARKRLADLLAHDRTPVETNR